MIEIEKLVGGAGGTTGAQWLHLLTATAVWVVLPAAVGVTRLLRAEIAP
jgi:hypothetical protein